MNDYIELHKENFEKSIARLKEEYSKLRTGRANPAIVENILVDSYGTKTPMKQLSSISIPDARSIMISPWDKSIIKEIEKAITYADIGLTPSSISEGVIINLPPLTEENRKNLVKILMQKAEEARISARGVRDKAKEDILRAEKDKEINEDDKYKFIKELDEYIQQVNLKIKTLAEDKEKEIMTV